MNVDQSGNDNIQHVGDVINHYYFGKDKSKNGIKLPTKVFRVFSIIPYLVYISPMFIPLIYFISTGHVMHVFSYITQYILLGYMLFCLISWYFLPILFPNLLMVLMSDRIIYRGNRILFKDIFRMEMSGKRISMFYVDGREGHIDFESIKSSRLVFHYYSIAVKAEV